MDKFVPISFICSAETESERIIHACIQSANGFYRSHKFAVLPRLIPQNSSTIYLPNLNYDAIPDFWDTVSGMSPILPLRASVVLKTYVADLLKDSWDPLTERVQQIEGDWKGIESLFWEFVTSIIPENVSHIKTIEVRLTSFGSCMSFSRVSEDSSRKFICYLRKDMSVSQVAEAIITGLIRIDAIKFGVPWENAESISDFLVNRLHLRGVLTDHTPTLRGLQEVSPALQAESDIYLRSLGLHPDCPFVIFDGQIWFQKMNITSFLSMPQRKVLVQLIKNSDAVVSYDDLGKILWKDSEDSFSLWAINKQMQRLREKLEEVGASGENIRAVKGQGYVLHNS